MRTPQPSAAGEQALWRVNRLRVSRWRMWGGEAVIYDDLSGDTLKLDAIMSEIFRRLQQAEATRDELVGQLVQALDFESADFRSEERRVGIECVRTCRSRWSPEH